MTNFRPPPMTWRAGEKFPVVDGSEAMETAFSSTQKKKARNEMESWDEKLKVFICSTGKKASTELNAEQNVTAA
jgi:hypothetical protein